MKIGLEVHAELKLKTKLFCSCPTKGSVEPNTRTCEVCLGMPGSRPRLNKKAVEHAVRLALALNCNIADEVVFSRKSYFYPDMSKNFQITQYENPIGSKGFIQLERKIGIKRVHLEEDPAALVHPGGIGAAKYVLVDYNRSGNPLVEIVTEPELRSPGEARDFMKTLITILRYLDIYDPSLIIKADANISVKETGFTRTEIKNITGFKEIEQALNYEAARHQKEQVVQETRLWNAEKGITYPLRTKETEEDYGYIFEPDLVPVTLNKEYWQGLKIPELPKEKQERYIKLGVSKEDARIISNDYSLAQIFEKSNVDPVFTAKWIRRELLRVLNYRKIEAADINEKQFLKLLEFVNSRKITEKAGQTILEKLSEADIDVQDYVKTHNLKAFSDASRTEELCKEVIAQNPNAVDDYNEGNENSLNFLVGQVMSKSRGKADPVSVKDTLKTLMKNY